MNDKLRIILFFVLVTLVLGACEESSSKRTVLSRLNAQQQLKLALSKSEQHKFIDSRIVIIKDSLTAISIAEPILFSLYGKEKISSQRPYNVYRIEKYWVLSGTMLQNQVGGTFFIIINAKDSKVISVTHGK